MGAHIATDATFDEILATTVDRLVVYFWAPWCAPCRQLSPAIDRLVDVEPQVMFIKVNSDENPQTARRFGVQAVPTILFLEKGELAQEILTGITPSVLRRRLLQWLD